MTAQELTAGMRLKAACQWWPCSEKTMRKLVKQGLVRSHRQTPNGPLVFVLQELIEDRARIDTPQEQAPTRHFTLDDYRAQLGGAA